MVLITANIYYRRAKLISASPERQSIVRKDPPENTEGRVISWGSGYSEKQSRAPEAEICGNMRKVALSARIIYDEGTGSNAPRVPLAF